MFSLSLSHFPVLLVLHLFLSLQKTGCPRSQPASPESLYAEDIF